MGSDRRRIPEKSLMTFHPLVQVVSIVAVIAISTTAGAWPHKNRQGARVRFLATSTVIRTWGAPNEDTYLAELTFIPKDDPLVVRLIDSYPNVASPLSKGTLASAEGQILKVRRDMNCDRTYGKMILRTAPGDPMAILPERLGYQPSMNPAPASEMILPCYRIVRR
jgi:hypothetical protein